MIQVSIIVPVYNGEAFLAELIDCLVSAIKESGVSAEILLINDGSNDNSKEICERAAEAVPMIKTINKENGGISDARNVGIDASQGDYICFCDQDDIYAPNLVRDVHHLAMETSADVVKFNAHTISVNNNEKEKELFIRPIKAESTICCNDNRLQAFSQYEKCANYVWNGMYRARVIKDNNIRFDTRIKYGGEDFDFCYKLFPYVNKVVFSPKYYYNHIIRSGISVSSKLSTSRLETSVLICETLKNTFVSTGLDVHSRLLFDAIAIQARKNARVLLNSDEQASMKRKAITFAHYYNRMVKGAEPFRFGFTQGQTKSIARLVEFIILNMHLYIIYLWAIRIML